MNTGVGFMKEVSVQRLNSLGKVLYEEKFSILDSFGTETSITEKKLSLLSVEEFELRVQSFITWIRSQLQTSLEITSNSYIENNCLSCVIPTTPSQTIIHADTTLFVNGESGVLLTTFDKVGVSREQDYNLSIKLVNQEESTLEVDYLESEQGELIYKSEISQKELVLDINSEGELILIGEDADHFSINSEGELIYTY